MSLETDHELERTPGTAASARDVVGIWSARIAILVPAVALGLLAWLHRWTTDDAFIFFRVVDQLLHGNGPVFNAGQRVEVATSPLWVAILTVSRLVLGGSVRLEYIAMWLALACSMLGVVGASSGALRLAGAGRGRHTQRLVVVPFGTLLVLGASAFWDYSTSGLEMGLAFAWIGAGFWLLVTTAQRPSASRLRIANSAVAIGLGPLIRPDFGVFSAVFLLALLLVDPASSWPRRWLVVGAAVAPGLAYEIFRMGYYAALVPNPAIAKNASGAQWTRGFEYLRNLNASYLTFIPVALILAALVSLLVALRRARKARDLVAAVAPAIAGMLHALYVVRVGGDFMHARLLLPGFFALMCPVAVIIVSKRWLACLALAMAMWALLSGITLRPINATNSGDQRAFYIRVTHNQHPVTLADYRRLGWLDSARTARSFVARHERVLFLAAVGPLLRQVQQGARSDPARTVPLKHDLETNAGLAFTAIGAVGYAAGPDVFVVDRLGLGDPVGSRIAGSESGNLLPGHEKYLSTPWVEALAGAPSPAEPRDLTAYAASIARQALRCGALASLMHDVDTPLTPSRFLGNISKAFSNTRLTVPSDVKLAERKFCQR